MSKISGAMTVETTDVMSSAIKAAMTRVSAVPKSLTLVEKISKQDWKVWDASQEKALVADTESLLENFFESAPPKVAA